MSILKRDGSKPLLLTKAVAARRNAPPTSHRGSAAGLVILGLVLLLLELRPWPPPIVFLDEDETARWWLHRAAFEGVLRSLVVKETTATGARARLRGRRSWRLRVDATASPQLRAEIEQLVGSSLERLGRAGDSSIQVRIRRARRVA